MTQPIATPMATSSATYLFLIDISLHILLHL
ncbi:Uncharacterised protein [Vibrio cholerae]|nr:Uncharacterised protein [Vibrio cholerae]CSI77753.1 Uncharacterised protein [Vibrio cholerae]CSI84358.1 Uncharacterised protein [Vibrio cholerae]